MSGTFTINGTDFLTDPTSHRWLSREVLGYDGNGHPVYPTYRDFEMSWQLLSPSSVNQLLGFFNAVHTTGSAVISLPKYGESTYQFFSYSGCVLSEPQLSSYFTEHITEVTFLVTKIRT